ncbi:hypothetical protein N7462_003405 [Penicillium macrosclerotiorum]|uniref:uncharacterized protein n=1 Tax=Penicillium macrosclerotiorum TaxID=303699 RepID=UPI0025481E2C|nr:uncharacterized protein N7462_003405 [Penicillium macrosclerotiorum]KAJ5689013.1 hypothetical protein N7462_003405 [Penicillium macrosclerotiorum]
MATSEYRKISEQASDIDCPTLETEETEELLSQKAQSRKLLRDLPSWLYAVLTICLATLSFTAGLFIELDLDRKCLVRHSYYSPALNQIDAGYRIVRFNSTVGSPTPFGGTPRPEIDNAWAAVDQVRVRGISQEELIRIGGSVDDVRLPDDLGGGYMASDMYTHELHCLNFLRKATYPEYYNQSHGFTDLPHVVRLHLDHCIELIRQFVVCQGDVGLYTFQWLEHYPTPYPKFSTWHQCRNTDSIETWITQGAIQTPSNYTWPRVPGSIVFPRPDAD